MRNLLLFFLIAPLLSFLPANAPSYTISGRYDLMTTDNLGNLYLVKGPLLEKYDPSFKLVKTYSTKAMDKITSVDATNPMKILVYFKDQSEIVYLDNMLAPTSDPISLSQLAVQPPCVCTSYNNGLWIFDPVNTELFRVDQYREGTHRTGNLDQVTHRHPDPVFLTEYDNKVYLADPAHGVLVFDIYGTYSKTIPLIGARRFQVQGDYIFYVAGRKEIIYNMKTLEQDTASLAPFDSTAIDIRFHKELMILHCEQGISVHHIK